LLLLGVVLDFCLVGFLFFLYIAKASLYFSFAKSKNKCLLLVGRSDEAEDPGAG